MEERRIYDGKLHANVKFVESEQLVRGGSPSSSSSLSKMDGTKMKMKRSTTTL